MCGERGFSKNGFYEVSASRLPSTKFSVFLLRFIFLLAHHSTKGPSIAPGLKCFRAFHSKLVEHTFFNTLSVHFCCTVYPSVCLSTSASASENARSIRFGSSPGETSRGLGPLRSEPTPFCSRCLTWSPLARCWSHFVHVILRLRSLSTCHSCLGFCLASGVKRRCQLVRAGASLFGNSRLPGCRCALQSHNERPQHLPGPRPSIRQKQVPDRLSSPPCLPSDFCRKP